MGLRKATVEDLMTPDPVHVSPETSVGEAYATMRERGFRHLPVVVEGALVGILSTTDVGVLGSAVEEIRRRPVGEIMAKNVITIGPSERVERAAALMASRKINCLPVVSDGALVGILTTYDLLDAFARSLRDEEPAG